VFCLPSYYEGMPGALLEAMACGIPAVAYDCDSGPREIFADGRFGTLVPVREIAALAAALLEISQDPKTARDRALAAQHHVEQTYAAGAVVERLQMLIVEALSR
jgi:glycosyltransferase involved in cell wall biosynthesis